LAKGFVSPNLSARHSVRALLPFGLLPLVWFSHVFLSRLGDPLGQHFDLALWLLASCLKLAQLASLLWLLHRVHRALFAHRALAVWAFATWALTGMLALSLLALTRHFWAEQLATSSTKFFFAGTAPPLPPDILKLREAALRALSSGGVFACEAALFGLLAGIQATTAFYLGRRPKLSMFMACISCEVALAGYVAWSPWFLSDYDFFHGDIVASPLLLDQVAVVASDPYTTLAIPVYLALGVSTWLIAQRAARY